RGWQVGIFATELRAMARNSVAIIVSVPTTRSLRQQTTSRQSRAGGWPRPPPDPHEQPRGVTGGSTPLEYHSRGVTGGSSPLEYHSRGLQGGRPPSVQGMFGFMEAVEASRRI